MTAGLGGDVIKGVQYQGFGREHRGKVRSELFGVESGAHQK